MDYVLQYSGYVVILEGYGDSNWIYNTKDSKSIIRYVFKHGGAIVS
jgi:hypothetical protein